MTTQQITLVKESFEQIKPKAQAAGELFYQKLFTAAPEARHLFRTPTPQQAGKLMYTLGFVVAQLHAPESMLSQLKALGQRHNQYGASPEHYDLVGAVLIDTLKEGLSTYWNAPLEEAWITAYQMLANVMMEAQQTASAA